MIRPVLTEIGIFLIPFGIYVLFLIATYDIYSAISSLQGSSAVIIHVYNIISFVLQIAEWIFGLGAVALLWRQESGAYFRARSGRA